MKAIGYSFSIRHVRTYILRAIEIQLLGTFHPASFKTERLVCVETDRRMVRGTWHKTSFPSHIISEKTSLIFILFIDFYGAFLH